MWTCMFRTQGGNNGLQDFKRLQRTSADFKGLQGTSRDFTTLQDFMRLHETSQTSPDFTAEVSLFPPW